MQRYLETLFRRKALFLFPFLAIPLLTLTITFYVGRQYTVAASVWVEGGQLLAGPGSGRVPLNVETAQVVNDRLGTLGFLSEVMDRAGLTDAILAGEWPKPTRLQTQLDSLPVLSQIGRLLGLGPPKSVAEALREGFDTSRRSVKATARGRNLVLIVYSGSDPVLGQRLIEEAIKLHQEETLATAVRETETGVEYLSRELAAQHTRLGASAESLARFEQEFPRPPVGLQRPSEELKELQRLQQDTRLEEARYLAAMNRIEDLRLRSDAAIATSDLRFRVIDPPRAGGQGARVSPRTMAMMGMAGVTLGLILGVVAIVLTTWRDRTIRTRADVERAIETPLIVEPPVVPSFGWRQGPPAEVTGDLVQG